MLLLIKTESYKRNQIPKTVQVGRMNKLNITIENSRCGLGDMLHRIDVIYRFCNQAGHNFYMPEVSSALHNNKYDDTLGISNYKPNKADWDGVVEVIDMLEFFTEIDGQNPSRLYAVRFNHAYAKSIYDERGLHKQDRLDYSPFIPLLNGTFSQNIDVLLHLRMGDSYIYSLSNDYFYHARIRKVIHMKNIEQVELDKQWNLNDVERIIGYCQDNNLNYKIHCDGIESVIRSINWTKDGTIAAYKEEIESAANQLEKDFLKLAGQTPALVYGNQNVELVIKDVLRTKLIVHTVGGFVTGINKFFNPNPCKALIIKSYLSEVICSNKDFQA
jgi:hypothetical protein